MIKCTSLENFDGFLSETAVLFPEDFFPLVEEIVFLSAKGLFLDAAFFEEDFFVPVFFI